MGKVKFIAILLLGLIFSMPSFALGKDSLNAVTMVSYDQEIADNEATLILKNNTKQTIHNVSYRITYYDMKGNVIDYGDFVSEREIEPGLARVVKIKAFQAGNDYCYYTSRYHELAAHRFKIKFALKGYNEDLQSSDSDEYSNEDNLIQPTADSIYNTSKNAIVMVVVFVFVITMFVGLYAIVGYMAKRRHRSVALWVLLSFVFTPLTMMLILAIIGRDHDIDAKI